MKILTFDCKIKRDVKEVSRMFSPINLESFKTGTVTLRVSNARNAPNSNKRPAAKT